MTDFDTVMANPNLELSVIPTGRDGAPAHRPDWFPIPGRYANPAASGIRIGVRPGRTSLDLKPD